jgi:hypothetical protein
MDSTLEFLHGYTLSKLASYELFSFSFIIYFFPFHYIFSKAC